MPKATDDHTATRRAWLAGSGALTLATLGCAGVSAAQARAEEPDAELIRQCAALVSMEAEWRASDLPDGNMPDRQDGYDELIEAVTDTPALTEAGNRAKLAVAVSFYDPDPPDSSIVAGMLWDAMRALALPFGRA